MNRMGAIGIVVCVCMGAMAPMAGGQPITQHVGANDPQTEGWTQTYYDNNGAWFVEDRPISPDPAFPEVDAWQIEADSGEIAYYYIPSAEDRAQIEAEGFTLTATWRMEWCRPEQNFEGNNCIEVRLPTGKVEMRMGYGETEDQRAVIIRDDDWPDSPVLPLGPDGYHTVKMVYDPRNDLVDVYVNDALALEDAEYIKDVDVVDNLYVIWGGCNAGNANDAINDYSSIQLTVGTGSGEWMTGDADGDGDVDDDDLSLLLANWGSETAGWGQGEFSGTPPVDDDDLSLLLANWTGAQLVPEPTMLGFLGICAIAVFRRQR